MALVKRNPKLLFLLLLTLAVLAIAPTMPKLKLSTHAAQHIEADEIRKCENITSVWLNSSGQRLNVIKELPSGECGNHVIQYSCRQKHG